MNALDAVTDRAATSCAVPVDDCVPYNPFALGGVTNEALNYLQAPGLQTGHHRSEHDDGRHHRRPRHDRRQAAVGGGVDQGRVRHRESPRQAQNTTDDLLTTAGAFRHGRPDDRHRGFDERQRLLHGSQHSAGSGEDGRRSSCRSTRRTATPTTARAPRRTRTSSAATGRRCEDVRFRASYPARGACAEHRRAVHRAGLQPVRHGRRSVRRELFGATVRREPAECLATGVPGSQLPFSGARQPGGSVQLQCRAATRLSAGRRRTPCRTASCSLRASRLA